MRGFRSIGAKLGARAPFPQIEWLDQPRIKIYDRLSTFLTRTGPNQGLRVGARTRLCLHTSANMSSLAYQVKYTRVVTSGSSITAMAPRNRSWDLTSTLVTSASALHLLCLVLQGHAQGQPHAPSVAAAAGVTAAAGALGESHSTASTRAAAGCTLPAAEGYTSAGHFLRRHRHETTRAPISWCTSSSSLRNPPTAWPVLGLVWLCN